MTATDTGTEKDADTDTDDAAPPPTETERRLARVEERLALLEDEAAVTRLVLSYGPLVDAGCAKAVADLWEPDGVYDVDELLMTGRDEIETMVRSDRHQGWIAGGCAHAVGAPQVTVRGDEAVAVCHSLMVVHDEATARFTVRRATANHWLLHRSPDGWRVTRRTSRVLDGRTDAPALLASGARDAARTADTAGAEA